MLRNWLTVVSLSQVVVAGREYRFGISCAEGRVREQCLERGLGQDIGAWVPRVSDFGMYKVRIIEVIIGSYRLLKALGYVCSWGHWVLYACTSGLWDVTFKRPSFTCRISSECSTCIELSLAIQDIKNSISKIWIAIVGSRDISFTNVEQAFKDM